SSGGQAGPSLPQPDGRYYWQGESTADSASPVLPHPQLDKPNHSPRWHLDNSPKLDRFYFRFPVRLSGSKKMALAPETAMSRRVPPGMIHYIRELASLWRIDPRTDAELLAAFVEAGEEAAFTALVIRHGRAVWQVCRRVLANDADAEDAFQAAF